MSKILILLTSLAYIINYIADHVNSKTCDTLKRCAPQNIVFEKDVCVKYRNETGQNVTKYFEINTKNCKDPNSPSCFSYFSDETDVMCSKKPKPVDTKLSGSACEKDDDCAAVCDKKAGKCLGNKEGTACTDHYSCDIGFACLNFTCTKQLEKGGKCLSEYGCKNNLGCFNGECVDYYSLDDSKEVGSDSEDIKKLCKSGNTHNGVCVSEKLISSDECNSTQTECEYTYTLSGKPEVKFTRFCDCSNAILGKSFCPYGATSDKVLNDLNPTWKKWLNGEAMKEHTLMRYKKLPNTLKLKELEIRNYPSYKDADECLRNMFADSRMLSLSLLVISILGVFL